MDDHHVGAFAQRRRIGIGGVDDRVQVGIGAGKGGKARFARIAQEIVAAPIAGGFERRDGVAASREIAQHSAQEMGVAVVPTRTQGMGEIDEPHVTRAPRDGARSSKDV